MRKSEKIPECKGIKIAKFLAEAGIGSRRHCEMMVEEGRVRVNGRVMMNVAERVNPDIDVIKVGGKVLTVKLKAVFALHKPKGYVSTMSDPHARLTLTDLIPARYASLGLKPVGRLDKDSEGLLLMTNEGELANRVMHPRYGVKKVYLVRLDRPADDRVLKVLRSGMVLEDGMKLRSMEIKPIGKGPNPTQDLEITLTEGKKNEIRRGFAMLTFHVEKLKRIAVGPIQLGAITKGAMVELTSRQLKLLKKEVGLDTK